MDVVQTAMRRSSGRTSPQPLLLMAVGRGRRYAADVGVAVCHWCQGGGPSARPVVGSENNIQSIFCPPQKIYVARL